MPTTVTVAVVASYPNAWWHLRVRVSESCCVDSHTKALSKQPGNATSVTGNGILDTLLGQRHLQRKIYK